MRENVPLDVNPSQLGTSFLSGNSNKAGLPDERLSRERINEIIAEASKGSKYYQFQQKRDHKMQDRIARLEEKLSKLTEAEIQRAKKSTTEWMEKVIAKRDLSRTFVHVDMDAFFAAVEARDRPELAECPMAVGGMQMLCTANYVARRFGVISAMPGYIARKLCPQLVVVPPNFGKYRTASKEAHSIFPEYAEGFVSASLDEACLDITEYLKRHPEKSVEEVCAEIRQKVFQKTRLTCSAGVACNRRLAKISSDINKPNGQFVLKPDELEIMGFMEKLPVRKISGVGKVMAKILQKVLQIENCVELIAKAHLVQLLFSKIQFEFLLQSALGLGSTFFDGDFDRKSMSVERTFETAIFEQSVMLDRLQELCDHLAEDLSMENLAGKTVGIKAKSTNFEVATRARTLDLYVCTGEELFRYSKELLIKFKPNDLRLLGIRLSNLVDKEDIDTTGTLDSFFSETEEGIVCPICRRKVANGEDEVKMNAHIDNCLTKQALREEHNATSKSEAVSVVPTSVPESKKNSCGPSRQLTEQEKEQCREVFALYDRSGSGLLPVEDLGHLMRSLGRTPSDAQIREHMASLAQKSPLTVQSFTEFIQRTIDEPVITEDELLAAFKVFDKQNNGTLPTNELRHIVTSLGEKLTEEEADEMCKMADPDGTGTVAYGPFSKKLMSIY